MENSGDNPQIITSLFSQKMKLTDPAVVMDNNCVLHQAINVLSDKWALLILLALLHGTKRTGELQKQIRDISPKMLVQTLKKLQSNDLVERVSYPEIPPRVEYQLTEWGRGLEAVFSTVYEWSLKRQSPSSFDLDLVVALQLKK